MIMLLIASMFRRTINNRFTRIFKTKSSNQETAHQRNLELFNKVLDGLLAPFGKRIDHKKRQIWFSTRLKNLNLVLYFP